MATISVLPVEGATYSLADFVDFVDFVVTEAEVVEGAETFLIVQGVSGGRTLAARIEGTGFGYLDGPDGALLVQGVVETILVTVDGVQQGVIETSIDVDELLPIVQADVGGSDPAALERYFQGFDWIFVGNDTAEIAPRGTLIGDNVEFNLRGNDIFALQGGDDEFFSGDGNDQLSGGLGNDVLDGGNGNDELHGDEGADTLVGGPGNDVLDGGSNPEGASGQGDVMLGGEGDDVYHVDSGLDLVDEGSYFPEFGFGGFDTIISTADFYWDIASVGERLIVSEDVIDAGGDGVTIVGGVFNNELIGHSGTDVLFGRGGSDSYRAGDGVDFVSLSTLGLTDDNAYAGVNGSNTVIIDPRTSGLFSYDIVFEFESGKDKLDVSAYAAMNGFASGADVMARGFNVDFDGDGLFTGENDSSYFILGDGLDYLYMVGTTLDEISPSDFIV